MANEETDETSGVATAPICPYCGRSSSLTTGGHMFPLQKELAGKWLWRCVPCDAHVACHPDTQVAMGTPAKRELRQARASLHNQLDPMWQNAPDLPVYAKALAAYPSMREEIIRKARERLYAYLGEKLGLVPADCHVNRRSNGTPFWALSASNRDPLAALGFGLRDHQG